jgi:hypothetical protein
LETFSGMITTTSSETIVWETTREGLAPLLAVVVVEIEALDPNP